MFGVCRYYRRPEERGAFAACGAWYVREKAHHRCCTSARRVYAYASAQRTTASLSNENGRGKVRQMTRAAVRMHMPP